MRQPFESAFASRLGIAACAVVIGTGMVGESDPKAQEQSRAIGSIQAYCNTSWRNAGIPPSQWPDCTQATFSELLGRIPSENLAEATIDVMSNSRRELNRSVWCVAQRYRRRHQTKPLPTSDFVEQRQASHVAGFSAKDLREAIDSPQGCLSKLQRDILHHLADGYSVAETSDQLGIASQRISHEKYRAIRMLREQLAS